MNAKRREKILRILDEGSFYDAGVDLADTDNPTDIFVIFPGWRTVRKFAAAYTGKSFDNDKYPNLDPIIGDLWGFDDSFQRCTSCNKVIDIKPDCYAQQPDFFFIDGYGYTCKECTRNFYAEEYLEDHMNRPALVNDYVIDPAEHGWIRLDNHYESGLHYHQDDDPKKVIRGMNEARFNVIFTGLVGQFDISWTAWAKPFTWDEDMDNRYWPVNAQKAIDNINAYQGYSTAREMEKVLTGRHSDYIKLETRVITQEEFINGNWLKN